MENIAPRTFKVLSHIVIFGSGSCAHSNWYYNEHKGCLHDNCIKQWLKIDGEEIKPKRNDAGTLWEYLSIVETENDFQDWLNLFVK